MLKLNNLNFEFLRVFHRVSGFSLLENMLLWLWSYWLLVCSAFGFSFFSFSIYVYILVHLRFWGTCAEHARLLHRYIHGKVVCCLHPPVTYIWHFFPCYPFPTSLYCAVPPIAPQQTLVCDAPLPVPMCSHCSTPTYEWEHVMLDFLFLSQFAENDGFQIYLCPCKGHELILFYGCIVFHGVYVPHFLSLIGIGVSSKSLLLWIVLQ